MPNILFFLFVIALFIYAMGKLSSNVLLYMFLFWLLWIAIEKIINNFGFVSYQEHSKIVKQLRTEKAQAENLRNFVQVAAGRLQNVIDDFGENFIDNLIIRGQDATFDAYLNNKSMFQVHLNKYIKRKAQKQSKFNSSNEKTETNINWRKTLGVDEKATFEYTKTCYRALSKKYHPDQPRGSKEKMQEINAAWVAAEKHYGR